jgi:hypothetical protein
VVGAAVVGAAVVVGFSLVVFFAACTCGPANAAIDTATRVIVSFVLEKLMRCNVGDRFPNAIRQCSTCSQDQTVSIASSVTLSQTLDSQQRRVFEIHQCSYGLRHEQRNSFIIHIHHHPQCSIAQDGDCCSPCRFSRTAPDCKCSNGKGGDLLCEGWKGQQSWQSLTEMHEEQRKTSLGHRKKEG